MPTEKSHTTQAVNLSLLPSVLMTSAHGDYATPTNVGETWKIRKCPYDHTCRAPADRFDHPHLSAALIATVIIN